MVEQRDLAMAGCSGARLRPKHAQRGGKIEHMFCAGEPIHGMRTEALVSWSHTEFYPSVRCVAAARR